MWTGLTNPTPKAGVILRAAQDEAGGMEVGEISSTRTICVLIAPPSILIDMYLYPSLDCEFLKGRDHVIQIYFSIPSYTVSTQFVFE